MTTMNKTTIITWETDEAANDMEIHSRRLDLVYDMFLDGKTDTFEDATFISPGVWSRPWRDQAAAEEFIASMIEIDSAHERKIISTSIEDII